MAEQDNLRVGVYFEHSDAESLDGLDDEPEDQPDSKVTPLPLHPPSQPPPRPTFPRNICLMPRCIKKQGSLYKQGGISQDKGWKQRWVVFDGQSLRYFKSKESPVSQRIIPVSSMRDVKPVGTDKEDVPGIRNSALRLHLSSSRDYQFTLRCRKRTFLFGTSDLQNCLEWQSCLMASIVKFNKGNESEARTGGEMNNPDISGSIRFNKNRKKFFAALKNDKFRYYYNEEDFEVDSPIDELSMSITSVKDVDKTTLQLVSHTAQMFTLHFDNVEETVSWKLALENAIYEVLGENSVVDRVRELEANTVCADCSSEKAVWASINLGIILCAKCIGCHRGLGVDLSTTKSLRMDVVFRKKEMLMQLLSVIGNRNANNFWYKHPPAHGIHENSLDIIRRKHIIDKYKHRKFADIQLFPSNEDLNKEFLKAVRQGDVLSTMSLLKSGANINWKSPEDDNKTALEVAEELHHDLVLEYLQLNKSCVQYKNEISVTEDETNGVSKTTSVYLENYLDKPGPNMNGYRKRWCVLNYGLLTYYDDKTSLKEKGSINIRDVVCISTSEERPLAFDLSMRQKKRVYRFAASNSDMRVIWMHSIIQIIQPQICDNSFEDLQIAGYFYTKLIDKPWNRQWLKMDGKTLTIVNLETSTQEQIEMSSVFIVYFANRQQRKNLEDSMIDYKDLDGNFRIELVVSQRHLYIQGVNVKDTERMFILLNNIARLQHI